MAMTPAMQAKIDEAKKRTAERSGNGAAGKPVVTINKLLSKEEIEESILSVPNLLESDIDETDHVIIYGDPGTGKTTAAGLLAEFYHLLWFDGDKGLKALKHNIHPEMLRRIHAIRIPDNTATPLMVDTMLKVVTGRQVKICLVHGTVACPICARNAESKQFTVALNNLPDNWIVVMDSQTQFRASAMAQIFYKVAGGKHDDVDDFWRGTGDEVFAYWGALKNIVEKFGNYVKDLRCKFVSISHGELVEMEDKVTKKMVPVAGSDKSSGTFAKYFGTVVQAKLVNNKIAFVTSNTYSNNVQTKSRSNVKLEEEKIPSLLHVFCPAKADELLAGSYNEWFFGKRIDEKTKKPIPMPQPKDIIPANGKISEDDTAGTSTSGENGTDVTSQTGEPNVSEHDQQSAVPG
jgi:hypothetical protein